MSRKNRTPFQINAVFILRPVLWSLHLWRLTWFLLRFRRIVCHQTYIRVVSPHRWRGDLRNFRGPWTVPLKSMTCTTSVSQRAQTGADGKWVILCFGPCRPSNQKREVQSMSRSEPGRKPVLESTRIIGNDLFFWLALLATSVRRWARPAWPFFLFHLPKLLFFLLLFHLQTFFH